MGSTGSAARTGGPSIDEIDTVANAGVVQIDSIRHVKSGERLGRYRLEEELGSGGMGTVFAAQDPELGRRVAVKVVHATAGRGISVDAAQLHLLKEGRALAALSHPNVVPIYDVGPLGDGIFVAMELVDGQTVAEWAEDRTRHWTEAVPVFIHAARGLAAAHDAGLIHRDFKPANVMIGRDGRIRVVDFGLAETSSEGGVTNPELVTGSFDESATARRPSSRGRGVVMGTPAFMSPEQHCGQDLDDRSDQFSFCVTLYRILYGQRPFTARPGETVLDAIASDELSPPPPGSNVPRRLRNAVARGLQFAPHRRWPSMTRLIEELEACMTPPSRGRAYTVLGGLGTLGVAGAAMLGTAADEQCRDPAELIEGVYGGDDRAELGAVFESSVAPTATQTWTRLSERLDDYTLRWSSTYARTCEAQAAGTLSAAQLDLRMTCLGDAMDELGAFVEVYRGGTGELDDVSLPLKAAAALPSPAKCERDVPASDPWQMPRMPDEHAVAAQAIRNDIRLSRALALAARYDESRTVAMKALGDAEALGQGPVTAEALHRVGNVEHEAGNYEEAATALQRAYWLAREHEHAKVAAESASDLIYVLGYHLARPEETDTWVRHAQAALDRWGRGGVEEALFLSNYGSVLEGTDLDGARRSYEQSLEIYIRETGPESGEIAMLHNNLAATLDEKGDFTGAREHYAAAIEMWGRLLGPDHPDSGMALLGMGVVEARQGERAQAMETLIRAERVFTEGLGPDSVHVGAVLISRSNVERALGDIEASIASLRRARQIYIDRAGPKHPYVAATSINLGQTLSQMGQHEEALAEFREAIRINRQTRGDAHPHLAGTLANMGSTLLQMGRPEEALDHYQRSLAMFEKTLGADHQDGHHALIGLGNTMRALGKPKEALAPLRRAVHLLEGTGNDPRFIVRARLTLAETLQELDPPRMDEAVAHARTALQEVGDDPTLEDTRASIVAFLEGHEAP